MFKSFHSSRELFICLFLIITTLAGYWQVKDHEFINFDDPLYVTENIRIQGGLTLKGVTWAFTTFHAGNWHPLTWLSHMLDVQLFGLKAGWHHLMNLLFHIANTLLLFLVFHRMTKALWQSAFVAALFALHPLHVESVAWVAERKDVLSTFFWMLTMVAYVFYVEKPGIKRYLLALCFFALGLMAKPMLVTLPFVLLLLDYWPLRRVQYDSADPKSPAELLQPSVSRKQKRKSNKQHAVIEKIQANKPTTSPYRWTVIRPLLWEKIPFFILTVLSSTVTYVAQRSAMLSLKDLPFDGRIANAVVSYVTYIGKMIWPANLAVFYPHAVILPFWQTFGAVLFLVIVTLCAVWMAKNFPYVIVGWLWYLGTMVPVVGIVQVGLQGMADRYTYVPLVGLFIIIVYVGGYVFQRWRVHKFVPAVVSCGVLFACMVMTLVQVRFWQDSITLFQHTLNATVDNGVAHNNLGTALRQKGKLQDAISHHAEAIRINPADEKAHDNMGNVLFLQGSIEESIFFLREAVRIKPDFAEAHYDLGTVMAYLGKISEAKYHFDEALRVKPDFAEAHYNLGNLLASQGLISDALVHYAEALRINPDDEKTHNNMGTALLSQGKISDAIVHFQEAVRLKPDYEMAQENLRKAMAPQGKAK